MVQLHRRTEEAQMDPVPTQRSISPQPGEPRLEYPRITHLWRLRWIMVMMMDLFFPLGELFNLNTVAWRDGAR